MLRVLRQQWRQVSFVHWRCPPEIIAPRLPEGLAVDTYDGDAWLSIIPFVLATVRQAPFPSPSVGSIFPETNLRTYVRRPDGRNGVWFFSLDADNRWITLAAPRLLGVPYVRARMSVEDGDAIRYRSERVDGRAAHDISVRPGAESTSTPLDHWLADRFRAYSRHLGRLLEIPVTHEPWPLRKASCTSLDETLTSAVELPGPSEPLVHYSDGVTDVAFGLPRVV